jgi:cephalosporin-C deacetylase-like acetyl esterase
LYRGDRPNAGRSAHFRRILRTSEVNVNKSLFVSLFLLGFGSASHDAIVQAEDLTCLTEDQRTTGRLYPELQRQAYAALDRRALTFEALQTPEAIQAYQRRLREFFVKQLGGFPERTPLHAKTVRTIDADGYRIENVIFESRPNHHVTANYYLPDGAGPFPGVIVSSGHSRTGKTADYNQRFAIAMAKNGMAALAFDPIGQGERSQILDASGEPQFKGTTTEHMLVGVGSILVGRNTASYRAWDAIRAIDYLVGRPEIDPKRIGMTGCSGGGTMTSYVMALDDRVACAAPACYLTTMGRLIETIGPQDAEQNIFGQIAFGLDQPDYIVIRAPKPTLISATSDDFFDIRGTWLNYRQSKLIYGKLGFPERVDLVEVAGKHGVQPQNLATITHWMRRWLVGKDDVVPVADLAVHPERDLLCTESGQVLKLPDERSVFDLNAEYEQELAAKRRASWEKETKAALTEQVRETVGVRPLDQLKPPVFKDLGREKREGYHIDKLVLTTDSGVPLPGLTFHPQIPDDAAYLYLHDDGKPADGAAGGPIEKLVSDGYAVVAVDLRGQGETGAGKRDPLLGDAKTFFLSYLLGKSLTGLRTEDTLAAAHFVAYYQKPADKPRKVHLVGVGQAGIVALHAAALRPEMFASVTLRKTPRDWSSAVKRPVPTGMLDATVHGALAVYDLPDLVSLIGKDKVKFEE